MNDQLLTITLLIVCVCNLGVLWLYFRIERWMQTPEDIYGLLCEIETEINYMRGSGHWTLDDIVRVAKTDGKLTRERIAHEHKNTRKETQEIKTRLTWSRKRELKGANEPK